MHALQLLELKLHLRFRKLSPIRNIFYLLDGWKICEIDRIQNETHCL